MKNINDPLASNITVWTCLDADRLDLPRVGYIVDPTYLFTKEAKDISKIF